MALAKDMTRIVLIGKLEKYTYDEEKPNMPGKGIVDIGGGAKARFTLWNRTNGDSQHMKAEDFSKEFNEGDKVYITGQDARQQDNNDESKFYENVQVWDYRMAEEDEQKRWVYVYVGTILNMYSDNFIIGVEDYKNNVMEYPIYFDKDKLTGNFEVGAKVKVKGTIFSGLKMDFFGDGEFVTERKAIKIEILNTKEEVEEENKNKEENSTESDSLWS